jgi:hypothetical protein
MAERPDVGQEAILDHVHRAAAREPLDESLVRRAGGGDERLGGQDPRRERLLDHVLTLGQELAELAPPARGLKLASMLQAFVLG